MKAKRKYLKRLGKGNKPEACESLSESEIEQLWTSNALGDHSPQNLQYTIWFLICLHMGMRGRDEHHKYKFGSFDINTTSHGKKYVEFINERGTKARTGENQQKQNRAFNPKMWEIVMQPNRYVQFGYFHCT